MVTDSTKVQELTDTLKPAPSTEKNQVLKTVQYSS